MTIDSDRTAITGRVIFEILRLGGRLALAGDRLVGDLGLSSARWQILSVAAFEGEAHTVSGIAEVLGLTRQSVRRVVNDLEREGLAELVDNPKHRRARLVIPTETGRAALAAAEHRRTEWTERLARNLDPAEARAAERVLVGLRKALDRS